MVGSNCVEGELKAKGRVDVDEYKKKGRKMSEGQPKAYCVVLLRIFGNDFVSTQVRRKGCGRRGGCHLR